MESRRSKNLLAPGFRFHPTDEELVRYYLRRKIIGKPLRFDAISEIDIYKVEPWDLPGMSRLKTRDLEWYFFSMLDRKHGNGAKTNRATEQGYWKTTGKDRAVHHKSKVVGMKKTLVYHIGRAPKGQRTNWVMHEYKLIDEELDKAGIAQDAFVLCRIFQKSGAGPKNGEKYGAPFVEEEWEDDELEIVPKEEAVDEVEFGDDIYLDGHDLEQILGTDTPVDGAPPPFNRYCEENASNSGGTSNSFEDTEKWLQPPDEQEPFDPAIEENANANPVKHEFMSEPSKNVNSEDVDYFLNEPIETATDTLQFNDGAFLEASDLSRPIDTSSFDMLEEYLTFFDADDDFQNMGFNPPMMTGGDDHVSDLASLADKNIGEVAGQPVAPSEEPADQKANVASSSKLEPSKFGSGSDYKYPFMKQASCMLGGIPAPPAFASEFPSKDAAFRMNSSSEASSSIHVTAGYIQIRNMTMSGNGTDGLAGKHGNYNILLSFGLSQHVDSSASLESAVSILPGKTISTASWCWFYYLFSWVLILSMSFKIGTLIRAT